MKRFFLRGIYICFIVFVMAACGGEGGGTAGKVNLDPPSANLAGTWSWTETTGSNDCGDPVGETSTWTGTVTHTSGSNNFTLTVSTDTFSGTINGSALTLTGSFQDGGGTTSFSLSGTVDGSGTSLSGTSSWTWTSGSTSCSGSSSLAAAKSGGGSSTGSLKITNGSSSYSITGIYLVEVTGSSWGSDLLTSSVSAGGSATVTNIAPGKYDVGIEFASGTAYAYVGTVEVSAGQEQSTTVSPMTTGALRVINNGSHTLDYLYFTPTPGSWGTDFLSSTLSPGSVFLLTGIPEDTYDYKIGNSSSYYSGSTTIHAGVMNRLTLE